MHKPVSASSGVSQAVLHAVPPTADAAKAGLQRGSGSHASQHLRKTSPRSIFSQKLKNQNTSRHCPRYAILQMRAACKSTAGPAAPTCASADRQWSGSCETPTDSAWAFGSCSQGLAPPQKCGMQSCMQEAWTTCACSAGKLSGPHRHTDEVKFAGQIRRMLTACTGSAQASSTCGMVRPPAGRCGPTAAHAQRRLGTRPLQKCAAYSLGKNLHSKAGGFVHNADAAL